MNKVNDWLILLFFNTTGPWQFCLAKCLFQISHSELRDLDAITQGGFGIAYRAKHAHFGTVIYKELDVNILGDRYSESFYLMQLHNL